MSATRCDICGLQPAPGFHALYCGPIKDLLARVDALEKALAEKKEERP